jgi:hypothetical protein
MQAKCTGPFKMKIKLQICLQSEFFKSLRDHRAFNYKLNKLKISKTQIKFSILVVAKIIINKTYRSLTILILNNF